MMIHAETKRIYEAFGLQIESDIEMPELRKLHQLDQADVEIRKGDLTPRWQDVSKGERKRLMYASENEVLFRVPDTAIFRIESGRSIVVSPVVGAEEDKVRLYILGTCMAIVLMQRKWLPLHGSAINIDGKAYAIVGHSGAGKSTLASVLMQRGFSLVSDDLIAVRTDEHGLPVVIPSYPQQKLWEESLQQLNMNTRGFRPLFERENKYAVPIHDRFHPEPLPLGGVFELVKSEVPDAGIRKLHGLHGIHMLYGHTFKNFIIERLGLQDWHFQTTVRMLKYIETHRIWRPSAGYTAHQLADRILSIVKGGMQCESDRHHSNA